MELSEPKRIGEIIEIRGVGSRIGFVDGVGAEMAPARPGDDPIARRRHKMSQPLTIVRMSV